MVGGTVYLDAINVRECGNDRVLVLLMVMDIPLECEYQNPGVLLFYTSIGMKSECKKKNIFEASGSWHTLWKNFGVVWFPLSESGVPGGP